MLSAIITVVVFLIDDRKWSSDMWARVTETHRIRRKRPTECSA